MKASVPLFLTHHSPIGSWSSLTFGLAGRGVSIDLESPGVESTADLIVAVSRGPGHVTALPFASGTADQDNELRQTSAHAGGAGLSWKERWRFVAPSQLVRTLTPAVDEFRGGDLTLRVLTPHPRLPDPDTSADGWEYALCPAILVELSIDNTGYDMPAVGFLGLGYLGRGRITALDGRLCGVGFSGNWCLAALSEPEVFTIRDNSIAGHVEAGRPVAHNGGQEGGIAFSVPAGSRKTLTAVFAFYRSGLVTQGIAARYLYTRHFSSLSVVAEFLLGQADRVRRDCAEWEAAWAPVRDIEKSQVFSQALRAYGANTQVLEAEGRVLYNVSEGQYLWRNTLDLAADHLPHELSRNPWVVRNIMDQFIDRYSYRDRVRFSGRQGLSAGGLSFTHDMGNFTTYSSAGASGYEQEGSPNYGFMTTEELLNGVYGLTAYVLSTQDRAWAARRMNTAKELLTSLENRDDADPDLRNGLLKAESDRCGSGHEITTYDCLDPSLMSAAGNLYLAVKTGCAALLLAEFFRFAGSPNDEARTRALFERNRRSLSRFWHPGGFLKAQLGEDSTMVIAAVEPLAVPLWLGLGSALSSDRGWLDLLRGHVRACLVPGACIDAETGGLRLSSGSVNTWPSKVTLCVYVMENLFGIDVGRSHPSILRELAGWTQISAAETTIADQIDVATRRPIGAFWYPRAVTSAVWAPRVP